MTGRAPSGEGSVYRRESDGKWCAAVTLPSGRRKVVYGVDEKAALKARRALLAEIEAGRPVPLGRTPTLGAYLVRWLDVRIAGEVEAGHLDESTADSYRQMVEGHLLPTFLAKVKINALVADDVRAWQRERLKAISSRGKPFSPRTVGMAHAALRRALNDAMRDEIIGRNVATLVRLPSGQSRPAEQRTEEEMGRVFAEMVADRHRVLWFTMLAFGPRRGEALAMRWSLTDLDASTTALRKQMRRVRGEMDPETGKRRGRLVEKDLKTAESRATLSLPAALVEMLRAHRRNQAADRLAARVWVDPDLVFTTSIGTALEPRNVNRSWSAVCARAGVEGVRLHDLRHAAASLAFAEGASIKEVQSMLRHTRQATTSDLYVHVFESVRRGTADRMDAVLRKFGSAG
ncbi:tyrosine-type recombinase/integrase [Micromonospora sp. NBC_01813]|uniref:tyrosine-type recombinase/integrase n=1 Tax=Micromonospora sp. NBC_01813 TaxID=2975988 RepID=UPI002DDB173A|nr:tyrosine-type recombinase/integrase [Micromonospora sp. NBC_01813]WSA07073.1 site-specific integrase [Micromonospora sp. NBC_01813]